MLSSPRILALIAAAHGVGCVQYNVSGKEKPESGATETSEETNTGDASTDVDTGEPDDNTGDGDVSGLEPDIAVTPTLLDFRGAEEGVEVVQTFTVLNEGDDTLDVWSIDWSTPGTGFTLLTPAEAMTGALEPGERFEIDVAYTSAEGSDGSATILVQSNDPDESEVPVDLIGGGCSDAPSEPFVALGGTSDQIRLVFRDVAAGTFSHAVDTGDRADGQWMRPQVADFDGDGVLEVVARRADTNNLVRLHWGCDDWETELLDTSLSYIPFGVHDFDGDGNLDLYGVGNDRQNIWVGLGRGDGSFDHQRGISIANVDSGYAVRLSRRADDVNGDGHDDLIVADYPCNNHCASRISVALGDSTGQFATPIPVDSVETPVNGIDFFDADGDGQKEILAGLDDDGDAGQIFAIELTTALESSQWPYFDATGRDESWSTSNAAGGGAMGATDWDGLGSEELLTTYNENPYASAENHRLYQHEVNADGDVVGSMQVAPAGLFYTGAPGIPVW